MVALGGASALHRWDLTVALARRRHLGAGVGSAWSLRLRFRWLTQARSSKLQVWFVSARLRPVTS